MARALSCNNTLKILHLQYNAIHQRGLFAFRQLLAHNCHNYYCTNQLQQLWLWYQWDHSQQHFLNNNPSTQLLALELEEKNGRCTSFHSILYYYYCYCYRYRYSYYYYYDDDYLVYVSTSSILSLLYLWKHTKLLLTQFYLLFTYFGLAPSLEEVLFAHISNTINAKDIG